MTELGLNHLEVIPALVLGVQSLIGMPLANILLRKYAVKLRDGGQFDSASATEPDASNASGEGGDPGAYILCQEISRSVGRDEREQKAIFDELITPMLVGGFTTVMTASIVVASIPVQAI